MMAYTETGESVRGFAVVVDLTSNAAQWAKRQKPRRTRGIRYPVVTGAKALALMRDMEQRGYTTIAHTEANGIEEQLTLTEMQEIFRGIGGV